MWGDDERTDGKRQRKPRRVAPGGVEAAAMDYLRRFEVSEARLRLFLQRKVRRSAAAHGDPVGALLDEVEGAIASLRARGYVNDGRHAESRTEALFARGLSPHAVRARLRAAGVAASSIEAAIMSWQQLHGSDQPGLDAAWTYARRRRLGPFRGEERAERRAKDLAAMLRAGHAMADARRVVDAEVIPDSAWRIG